MHILFVDSDPGFIDVAKSHISKLGEVDIETASNGHEALERMKGREYDLVISENRMPKMSGIELLKALRSSGNDVPFFFFSNDRGDVVIEALNNDADLFFQKGGDPKYLYPDLLNGIKRAVDHHRRRSIMERNSTVLRILNEMIIIANQSEKPATLLNDILDQFLRSMDFSAGGIYRVDQKLRKATLVCHRNLPREFVNEVREVDMDAAPYDYVFNSGKTLLLENYGDLSPEHAARFGIKEICIVPLVSRSRIIGCLNVVSRTRTAFTKDEKIIFQAIGKELGSAIEKLEMEVQLGEERQNLMEFINSVNDMHFVLDMRGHIISTNMAVVRALGYTMEELIGMDVLELHFSERRDEAKWIVSEMIMQRLDVCRVPLQAKNGMVIEVETRVCKGKWNGVEALFGVTRDMTVQRNTEKSLLSANKKLTLCSDINRHDIMNQVAILGGYLEMERETVKEDSTANQDAMKRALDRIAEQLTFTQDYTRIGMVAPQWQDVEMVFQKASRNALGENIKVEMGPMPYEIMADPLLERVFFNLIDNSLRHGKGVTRISMRGRETKDGLVLSYEDDGCGVGEKEKEKIFVRGFGKNSGYGLFFARETLALTGIEILENGRSGEGARFEMRVPKDQYHPRDS